MLFALRRFPLIFNFMVDSAMGGLVGSPGECARVTRCYVLYNMHVHACMLHMHV